MSEQRQLMRPDARNFPTGIWPPHRETVDLVVDFDLGLGGRYVTAECQMGAHHACPGGLRTECQVPMPAYRCRCVADGCGCKPVQEPSR